MGKTFFFWVVHIYQSVEEPAKAYSELVKGAGDCPTFTKVLSVLTCPTKALFT